MDCPTCFQTFPINEIAEHADICASWYVDTVGGTSAAGTIAMDDNSTSDASEILQDGDTPEVTIVSLMQQLQNNLEPGEPVRINLRRKTLWEDFAKERRKRVKLKKNKIKVVFLGEPAIDDGRPRREFFSGIYN